MRPREIGIRGEMLAQDFLREHGYNIVETNYRCPHGEIDIIAQDGDCLAFVEVRTRTSFRFGSPEESVTRVKKERLVESTYHYLQAHEGLADDWRIDFVAVEMDESGTPSRIDLLKGAVDEV